MFDEAIPLHGGPEDPQLLLEELRRREARRSIPARLLEDAFPASLPFLRSAAKQRSLLCPRRAGKTNASARLLVGRCSSATRMRCLFLALTRLSAKNIVWEILKDFDRRYSLGARFREADLQVVFTNGSTISLMGLDASKEEREKILVQPLDVVVIDESASFTIDLKHLVETVIRPATLDRAGKIVMIGCPNGNLSSFFAKVTQGQIPGWEVHKWSTLDNPHMAVQMAAEMAELAKTNPLYLETPQYKQHYLGQWVIDLDARVYKFDRALNLGVAPEYATGEWHYVLGGDLGFDDACSISAGKYHENDPHLYIVRSWKQPRLDITGYAQELQRWRDRYNPVQIVIDGAHKQAVMEIRQRHAINVVAAEKTAKFDFIDLVNADLLQGLIKIDPDECLPLIDELEGLVKNERKFPEREEHPSCPNHCCDTLLYLHRFTRQYLSMTPVARTQEQQFQLEEQRFLEQIEREKHERDERDGRGSDEWL